MTAATKRVPREPTQEMLRAKCETEFGGTWPDSAKAHIWRAMFDAAQEAQPAAVNGGIRCEPTGKRGLDWIEYRLVYEAAPAAPDAPPLRNMTAEAWRDNPPPTDEMSLRAMGATDADLSAAPDSPDDKPQIIPTGTAPVSSSWPAAADPTDLVARLRQMAAHITSDAPIYAAECIHYSTAMDEAADALEAAQARVARLLQEAQIHAQEARTANATIAEIYQVCTGATSEPGNWNGAAPVRALKAERDRLAEALRERDRLFMEWWFSEDQDTEDDANYFNQMMRVCPELAEAISAKARAALQAQGERG